MPFPKTEAELSALIAKSVVDGIKAATAPMVDIINKQKADIDFLKMSDAEQAHCAEMDDAGKKAFMALTAEERKAKMAKAMEPKDDPIAKALAPIVAQNEDLKKRLDAVTLREEQADFAKRAVAAGLPEADGEVMRKAFRGDAEAAVTLEKKMVEMNNALQSARKIGKVFGEFGSTHMQDGATAYGQILAKAAELRKADPKLSEAQAFDKAYNDPANTELREQAKADEAKVRKAALA